MNILAISGDLSADSLSTGVLRAASLVAPGYVKIDLYRGLADLPVFNPDLHGNEPGPVLRLRSLLLRADGVLICSPQYAHGIPGGLKNALDWISISGELAGKPMAALAASPCESWAHTLLIETLQNLSANVVGEASVLLSMNGPVDGKNLDANWNVMITLQCALTRLTQTIREQRARSSDRRRSGTPPVSLVR